MGPGVLSSQMETPQGTHPEGNITYLFLFLLHTLRLRSFLKLLI